MWLTLTNTEAKVTRASAEETGWLREYLSFEDAQARFRWGNRGDGRVRMYDLARGSFPAGFLGMVRKAAEAEGFPLEVMDLRTAPAPPADESVLAPLGLRDYQLDAVRAVVARGRGIIMAPTGSGKGTIIVGCALLLPGPWLCLVHRASLMEQQAERWEQLTGLPAGRIGEGRWEPGEQFTVATLQTLYRNLGTSEVREFLAGIGGMVTDEAHIVASDSYFRVCQSIPHAYYRVGTSATPLSRGDRRNALVIGATGPVIYQIKPQVLIDAGVLSKPRIKMLRVEQESECPTWQGVYGDCVVRSAPRNRALVRAAQLAQKPCLVFVKEISHGRALTKALGKAKVNAEFVWGKHSVQARQEVVRRLLTGRIDVLVCSVIFQEGIDIPELRSVVVGSGGKSVIAALQRIGRGMRVSAGKTEFEVFDIADAGNKWLVRHTRERLKSYVSQQYEVVLVEGT